MRVTDKSPNRSIRILLVDDDALIAMSTLDMLEEIGHTAVEANSGRHALEILASEGPFDLIMTDYSMPGMTGTELADTVRQSYPQMPILLATGYTELPSGKRSDLARIGKPYLPEQLRVAIDRLLDEPVREP